MSGRILEMPVNDWQWGHSDPAWAAALEAGKVLYFPQLPFRLQPQEQALLDPQLLAPKVRNISLDGAGELKGAQAEADTHRALTEMVGRFRHQAQSLVESLLPRYRGALRVAATSYRPMPVDSRRQSWRADDRRMHVDAFPSRPNYGERILRVFTNINPHGEPRVWRLGERFDDVVRTMLPRAKRYVAWRAGVLDSLGITKSRRSEYDHLMLQLHDQMKSDLTYQQQVDEQRVAFPPGSVWVCFSDQVSHGVLSGQYMLEQTLHLAVENQYDPGTSPLAVLQRHTGRALI